MLSWYVIAPLAVVTFASSIAAVLWAAYCTGLPRTLLVGAAWLLGVAAYALLAVFEDSEHTPS